MTETKWFKIVSFLHLTVMLSICFCAVTLLSLTILLIPAVCAAFAVGRDLIEKRFNVYEGVCRRFFQELKHYLRGLRFLPVWLLVLLQLTGIAAAQNLRLFWLQIGLLVCAAILMTYLFYACAYMVFLASDIRCEEVLVRMFRQVKIVFSLFCLMILLLVFFQLRFLPMLLIFGAILLLIIEAVIYLTLKEELEEAEAGRLDE